MRDSGAVFTALLLRDGSDCYLCGQSSDADDPLEIEHVRPRASFRGDLTRSDDLSNLRLAHKSCNRFKGTRAVVHP